MHVSQHPRVTSSSTHVVVNAKCSDPNCNSVHYTHVSDVLLRFSSGVAVTILTTYCAWFRRLLRTRSFPLSPRPPLPPYLCLYRLLVMSNHEILSDRIVSHYRDFTLTIFLDENGELIPRNDLCKCPMPTVRTAALGF